MSLSLTNQVLEIIKRSRRPVICLPIGGGIDAYATALGLTRILRSLDKEADIVATEGPAPTALAFLSNYESVQTNFENIRRFIVEINTKNVPLQNFTHESHPDKLQIHLSSKYGAWTADDITFSPSGFRYDLIISVGAPDLQSFGHLYEHEKDFFIFTPIINIDHKPENEHFGQLNIIDLTATACGEVCYDLFEKIDTALIDKEVATAFLTGIIAKTQSFREPTVSPKTLNVAGKLMDRGARRDQIVEHLYRTRSIPTLRLWGRALARLKSDANLPLVWTMLSQQDFMHAGAREENLPDVIQELIMSSPNAKIALVFYENEEKKICTLVRTERPYNAIELLKDFSPTGIPTHAFITKDKQTIVEMERVVINTIKNKIIKSPF